ncbi:MAG: aminoglycoside phosphotransferase family protein [Casimicrobiaceae bacterium]
MSKAPEGTEEARARHPSTPADGARAEPGVAPDASLRTFVVSQGLVASGEDVQWTPLAGGVSSDIWRVDASARTFCVKRALPKLKVERDWFAPVQRNAHEWAWLDFAGAHCPGAAPRLLAHDPAIGAFAMEWLDPATFPVWKARLLEGDADAHVADEVGWLLARLHAASATDDRVPVTFATDDVFFAIRLEPYLIATGDRHPRLAPRLTSLARRTLGTHRALVHGDVSPKNILVGAASPIFLDAECAWFGDPAFDLAFCLNHFLLKCLARRAATSAFLRCFTAMRDAYVAGVDWEPPDALERRAAELLPALLLARVDGKSPVEYVTLESDRELVRQSAAPLILHPVERLEEVAACWGAALK